MTSLTKDEQVKAFRAEVRINIAKWLNTKEAAQYLRCSEVRLETWRHDKLGPPFKKIGRSVIYARKELDTWLREQS